MTNPNITDAINLLYTLATDEEGKVVEWKDEDSQQAALRIANRLAESYFIESAFGGEG